MRAVMRPQTSRFLGGKHGRQGNAPRPPEGQRKGQGEAAGVRIKSDRSLSEEGSNPPHGLPPPGSGKSQLAVRPQMVDGCACTAESAVAHDTLALGVGCAQHDIIGGG